MPSLGLTTMLLLLQVGNLFGLLTLRLKKEEMQVKNLLLTSSIINFLKGIQLLNIIAIAGVWFFHSWAAWLVPNDTNSSSRYSVENMVSYWIGHSFIFHHRLFHLGGLAFI